MRPRQITGVRFVGMIIACILAVSVANAQSDDELLRQLAEKARQREGRLGTYDWSFSLSVFQEETDRFEPLISGRLLRDGSRYFSRRSQRPWDSDDSGKLDGWREIETKAYDGNLLRTLREHEKRPSSATIGPVESDDAQDRIDFDLESLWVERDIQSNMFISDLLELDAGELDERYGKGLSVYDISRRVYSEMTDDGDQVAIVEITFDHREKPVSRKTILSFSRDLDYSCVAYERWTRHEDGNWKQGESFKLSDFVELEGVWVPTTVEVIERGIVRMRLTTESLEVPATVDDGLFAFDFPADTEVHDDIIDSSYVVGGGIPVLELLSLLPDELEDDALDLDAPEDGLAKPSTTPDETDHVASAPAAPPVTQEPPPAAGEPVERSHDFAWVVVAVLAAVLIASIVILRRKRT